MGNVSKHGPFVIDTTKAGKVRIQCIDAAKAADVFVAPIYVSAMVEAGFQFEDLVNALSEAFDRAENGEPEAKPAKKASRKRRRKREDVSGKVADAGNVDRAAQAEACIELYLDGNVKKAKRIAKAAGLPSHGGRGGDDALLDKWEAIAEDDANETPVSDAVESDPVTGLLSGLSPEKRANVLALLANLAD